MIRARDADAADRLERASLHCLSMIADFYNPHAHHGSQRDIIAKFIRDDIPLDRVVHAHRQLLAIDHSMQKEANKIHMEVEAL